MAVTGDPIQIPVGPIPTPVWSGVPNGPVVFMANTDPQNDVWVGYSQAITAGATNAVDIPTFGTVSMDGSRTIYAVALAGTNNLQVVPGGGNWSPSPTAIAAQIVTSGLAQAIAQALSGSGIPLVGAPQLLYNVLPPVSGAGIPVGATVDLSEYGYTDWLTTANQFDTYTNTPMAVVRERAYFLEGQWPPSPFYGRINELNPTGCTFEICMFPSRTLSAAEQVNLANEITILQRGGVTFSVVLCTEPNIGGKFPSATAYAQYIAYYGPVVANPAAYFTLGGTPPNPVNLIYNPAYGADPTGAVAYYPGDNYSGAAYTFYAISVDYYGNGWLNGTTLDAAQALADGPPRETVRHLGVGQQRGQLEPADRGPVHVLRRLPGAVLHLPRRRREDQLPADLLREERRVGAGRVTGAEQRHQRDRPQGARHPQRVLVAGDTAVGRVHRRRRRDRDRGPDQPVAGCEVRHRAGHLLRHQHQPRGERDRVNQPVRHRHHGLVQLRRVDRGAGGHRGVDAAGRRQQQRRHGDHR